MTPRYYRAYDAKEALRLILKMTDYESAKVALRKWRWRASHSRLDSFKELASKIKRNEEFILNTIKHGFSNARIEATNNKIKLIIRRSYGFKNINNMLDMIYLWFQPSNSLTWKTLKRRRLANAHRFTHSYT